MAAAGIGGKKLAAMQERATAARKDAVTEYQVQMAEAMQRFVNWLSEQQRASRGGRPKASAGRVRA